MSDTMSEKEDMLNRLISIYQRRVARGQDIEAYKRLARQTQQRLDDLMKTEEKRGGLRNPPGGRPPKAPEDRKVKINITITKALHEKLLARRDPPNEPLSHVIERLLSDV